MSSGLLVAEAMNWKSSISMRVELGHYEVHVKGTGLGKATEMDIVNCARLKSQKLIQILLHYLQLNQWINESQMY